MTSKSRKTKRSPSNSNDVEQIPGNARDRQMGRADQPLGDLGSQETWEPPPGEQGLANRPDDDPVQGERRERDDES